MTGMGNTSHSRSRLIVGRRLALVHIYPRPENGLAQSRSRYGGPRARRRLHSRLPRRLQPQRTVESRRIVKMRGSDALPYTEGVICNKVAWHSADFAQSDGRLLWPTRRCGASAG